MRVLELFKGTGSVSKFFSNTDYEVVSLDIDKKFNPTICCDILDWDYTIYPKDYFNIIWSSPECKIYSSCQFFHINKKYGGDMENLNKIRVDNYKFVNKVFEIIEYFNPTYWFVENPLNSAIKHAPILSDKPFIVVDYCYFGFDYQKPTRIWTNKKLEKKRCSCRKEGKKHKIRIMNDITQDLERKYSMPQKLLEYLFK